MPGVDDGEFVDQRIERCAELIQQLTGFEADFVKRNRLVGIDLDSAPPVVVYMDERRVGVIPFNEAVPEFSDAGAVSLCLFKPQTGLREPAHEGTSS